MTEKVLGYCLLIVGLVVIASSGISVYSVFTGRQKPVALFSFPGVTLPTDALVPEGTGKTQSTQIELLPGDTLNATSNAAAHLFLMGFLVTVGGKIASLGTYMLRPIVIHAKEAGEAKVA